MRTFVMPFKTTRGALEDTLLSLGFEPKYGNNEFGFPYVEYRHPKGRAYIGLSSVPADQPLDPADLLNAEHSVEWCGIADLTTFYSLLREKTPREMLAA
jgi:hypothetical protein